MKKLTFTSLLLMISLVSCLQQETISTGTDENVQIITSDNNSSTDGDTVTDTSGGTTTTTPGTGTSCVGNPTSDGQGDGTPMHQFELLMAGDELSTTNGQSVQYPWYPGISDTSGLYGDFISPLEAGLIFPSDSRLRVRFKVKPQPYVPAGQTYCKGRGVGQAGDTYKYKKLKFVMHLRDVICSSYNTNGQCTNAYLGARYRTQYIDATDENTCTPIMDIGHLRNQGSNIIATTVEVDQVRADSTCQQNGGTGYGCPAEVKVRNASCWQMTMQVVTDYTQDYK
jgi:hypothetical protein